MVAYIVRILRDLLLWLDPPSPPPPPAPPDPLDLAAESWVQKVEAAAATGTSGEYKRHTVYAELLKRFPERRKRDIALAIELAVQKVL